MSSIIYPCQCFPSPRWKTSGNGGNIYSRSLKDILKLQSSKDEPQKALHYCHHEVLLVRLHSILELLQYWARRRSRWSVIFVNVRIARRVCRAVGCPVRFMLNNLLKEALIKLLSLSLENLNNSYIRLPTENSHTHSNANFLREPVCRHFRKYSPPANQDETTSNGSGSCTSTYLRRQRRERARSQKILGIPL